MISLKFLPCAFDGAEMPYQLREYMVDLTMIIAFLLSLVSEFAESK